MMKNLLLITLLTLFSLNLSSQIINTKISNYESFDNGTTYFVKTTNNDLDAYIEDILKNYWTINNFEIISESEVIKTPNENSFYASFFTYSFSRNSGTTGALNMDYTTTKLLLFKALTETEKDIRKPIGTLSTVELAEISPTEIFYSILLMQNQIKTVKELNINKSLKFKKFLKRINKRKKDVIKQKTLYLKKSQLNGRVHNIDNIKKLYTHDFKIKSKEEIEQAILNNSSDIVYAKFIRLSTLHFLIIINAENGELLFGEVSTGFSQNKIGPRFLKKMNK